MSPLLALALLLVLCWGGLALLVAIDSRQRRRVDAHRAVPPAGDPGSWGGRALLALGVGSALLRLPFALGRAGRNVDESQYAASVAFARRAGESLFANPYGLRGHVLLYRLGDSGDPYRAVDAMTCAVYGLTAWLIGYTVWRALRRPGAGCLAAAVYALGTLRFEGLSSNAEPYVNLCLAAWVWVRFGRDEGREAPVGAGRHLAAGACLGAAAVLKEQALPLLFVEPLWGGVVWARDATAGRTARLARRLGLAALGYWLALAPWLGAFALAQTLGAYVQALFGWGESLGAPVSGVEPERLGFLLDLARGLLPLWASPLGWLGLAAALRALLEAHQAGRPGRRLELGLVLLLGLALVAISLGLRFFEHYFLLAWVPLAGLAGLRLADLGRELPAASTRGRRVTLGVLVAVALFLLVPEASRVPHQSSGSSLDASEQVRLAATARKIQEVCPPEAPAFVWGWREELYLAAERAPASRLRAGWALKRPALLLEELRADPPGVVVLVEFEGQPAWSLDVNPALEAWLRERYQPLEVSPEVYPLLVPRRR